MTEPHRFLKVTNRPSILGGKEPVVVTVRESGSGAQENREYRVLSVRGTSNLQKRLQQAADEGYEYREQTTMPNIFGGKDFVVILERSQPKE